jgi:hypothetical protein
MLYDMIYAMLRYGMIYLLTTVGLTPGGSSTVHIYTRTILEHNETEYPQRKIHNNKNIHTQNSMNT